VAKMFDIHSLNPFPKLLLNSYDIKD